MKKLYINAVLLLSVLLFAATGAHAWQFEIDNLENDLTFELWFNTQADTVRLDGYGLDFGYDAAEMDWAGAYTNTAPSPLIAEMLGAMYESSSGSLVNFNAATFGSGPTLNSGTRLQLGTISFDLYDPDTSVKDGASDLWFDLASGNLIVTLDVNGGGIGEYKASDGTFQYAYGSDLDIGTPVPAPAAVLLLGSGLLGLVGIRRRGV